MGMYWHERSGKRCYISAAFMIYGGEMQRYFARFGLYLFTRLDIEYKKKLVTL